MRFLYVCLPGFGHVTALAATACALARRGHDVRFAVGADQAEAVAARGLAFVDAGMTRDEAGAAAETRLGGLPDVEPEDHLAFQTLRIWAETHTPAMVEALAGVVRGWQPDAVVHDLSAFAGPLLAALGGVPSIVHSTGVAPPGALLDAATEAVAPVWAAHGRTVPRRAGTDGDRIEVWPAPMQPPDAALPAGRSWPVSFDAAPEGGDGADEDGVAVLDGLGAAPHVHVSLGTVFGSPDLLRDVIEALEAGPWTVTADLGERGVPNEVFRLPSDARVARWAAHRRLLPRCDVVVCHAGTNTVLTAARAGVPLVVLPQGADHFRSARGCERAGIGVALAPHEVRPDTLRSAVERVLTDPRITAGVAAMREHLAGLPTPDALAATVGSAVARAGVPGR